MRSRFAGVVAATVLISVADRADAQTHPDTTAIGQAVISILARQFRINSKVIVHLDLTRTFQTRSRRSLVIAKQPDEESGVEDGGGNRIGAVSLCFVDNDAPDCSEEMFLEKYQEEKFSFVAGEPTFHEFLASDIVFSGPGSTLPLLRIKSCMNRGANGNCAVSTFLFAYDRKTDRFRVAFFNMRGRNNNEETRFVENGPLLGSVIVAYPTSDAPFTYFVEVYKRVSDSEHSQTFAISRSYRLRRRQSSRHRFRNARDPSATGFLENRGCIARPANNAWGMYKARVAQSCRVVRTALSR